MSYANMKEVMKKNREIGQYWFSPGAMNFFKSRIESKLIGGVYFVTSEHPPHGPRMYSVREVREDGSIDTLGDFCGFSTLKAARAAAEAVTI